MQQISTFTMLQVDKDEAPRLYKANTLNAYQLTKNLTSITNAKHHLTVDLTPRDK